MNPDDQRIAIAETQGFVSHGNLGVWLVGEQLAGYLDGKLTTIPDYLNDRNAMHRAWATLSRAERMSFYNVLVYSVLHRRQPPITLYDIFDATPAEWAEAFLRVKGLWKETPAS